MTNRPTGVFKLENSYQQEINSSFYEKCPKAVFAALAVSYMVNHGIVSFEEVTGEMLSEWNNLYEQGIVPQKPPKL